MNILYSYYTLLQRTHCIILHYYYILSHVPHCINSIFVSLLIWPFQGLKDVLTFLKCEWFSLCNVTKFHVFHTYKFKIMSISSTQPSILPELPLSQAIFTIIPFDKEKKDDTHRGQCHALRMVEELRFESFRGWFLFCFVRLFLTEWLWGEWGMKGTWLNLGAHIIFCHLFTCPLFFWNCFIFNTLEKSGFSSFLHKVC